MNSDSKISEADAKNKNKFGIKSKTKDFLNTAFGKFTAVLSFLVVISILLSIFTYLTTKPISTQQIASKVRPCVVGIIQYKRGSLSESGEGSGIVISKDGYIVTNNHVVDGADRLQVVTCDNNRYSAKIIGTDKRTDIAVIKIEAVNLKCATFGDSDKCRVGDTVVAIGNPSGLTLAGSVTQGIISAIDRDIDVGNGPMNLIQTDAAINPGNSGGALINTKGEVIGINSAKIAQQGYEGIGFSIPISFAKPIVENIMQNGYVKGRVRFGMKCSMIDKSTSVQEKIPQGIYVMYVDPKSGAGEAGISEDDIITSIDGIVITSTTTLISERDRHKPGDTVTLTVYRRKTFGTVVINVKLTEDKGTEEAWAKAAW